MKTPITYYGGKQSLTKYLLPLVPSHKIYCEPFFGGGALFFAKPPSTVEVINDVNSEVINFFKVAKTNFSELQTQIQATPHSRELFKRAKAIYDFSDMFSDVQRAWAFWTLTNQGFAGQADSWGFGKDNSKERALANKRIDFIEAYAKRLETVQIDNQDALKVMERCDSIETFFYCDPPYLNSDQGHYGGYSENDFRFLLECLSKVKGKFLLSSYPHPLLTLFIKKHKWKTKQIKKSVWVTKNTNKQKIELMVFNYDEPIDNSMSIDGHGTLLHENLLQGSASDSFIELHFLKEFLNFNGKVIDKKTLGSFMVDLQKAILNKQIRKSSPYAKEIMNIQRAVVNGFNTMSKSLLVELKPKTLAHLKEIVESIILSDAYVQKLESEIQSLDFK